MYFRLLTLVCIFDNILNVELNTYILLPLIGFYKTNGEADPYLTDLIAINFILFNKSLNSHVAGRAGFKFIRSF